MKAIILAGGFGTRLSEITRQIPKPMVEIKKKPLILYIIEHYKKYGVRNFYIAAGYKYKFIKSFFKKKIFGVTINVINTGLHSSTALRIKKLEKFFLNDDLFFLTYGDAVSNVNISDQLKFHKKHKKIGTLLAVHPPARFGELELKKNIVKNFEEKPQLQRGWINGGFFIFNREVFSYLKLNKNEMLEREPIKILIKKKKLAAFKHEKFWMCMDTLRDKIVLEKNIHKIYKK